MSKRKDPIEWLEDRIKKYEQEMATDIKELNLKVKKVQLLIRPSTDLIKITIDAKSSFPIMEYPPVFQMECQKGFGKEYCKNVLGLTPKILDLT